MGSSGSTALNPWDRKVSELFSTVKISEPYNFSPDFISPIIFNESTFYVLISKNGLANVISPTLSEIAFKESICEEQIISLFPFDLSKIILTTAKGVILLTFKETSFEKQTFEIDEPIKCHKVDSNSFVLANRNGNVLLCSSNGSSTDLWKVQDQEIIDSIIFKCESSSVLIISTKEFLFLGDLSPNTKPVFHPIPNIRNLTQCDSKTMFFLNGKGDVCFLEVRDDKTVSDPTTIKNGTFCGLHCLCNGTVLFYSKNEICTYSLQPTPIIIGTTLINNHEIDKIIFMREPRVFIVMTKNGRLVVCRHPSFSKADKKPEIEQMELFQYHKEPIKVGCCGEELSFMTVDESGVCVLWENFPNWLDAPFTLGMFGESE